MLITSPANPRIGKVRDLHTSRGRKRSGLLFVEGLNIFEILLDMSIEPHEVYYCPDLLRRTERGTQLLQRILSAPLAEERRIEVTTRVIEALSDAMTSQGIVGTLSIDTLSPHATRQRRIQLSSSTSTYRPVLLVLDDIADPGNMGTILRTALATDVDAVLLTPDCTDPYSPKVMRAAAGTHFLLPLESDLSWAQIATRIRTHCGEQTVRVLLAEAGSVRLYYEEDLTHPFALIMGNEAHGPSHDARTLATQHISLPLANHVESLNAAMATGILLYEAARQLRIHNR
jgi:TrmH family RNA methyltransferase